MLANAGSHQPFETYSERPITVLDREEIEKSVALDDDLRTTGLSSLGLVNLMLSVEGEFDLKIPERDMTPANFRSIMRIVDLVDTLSQAPAAST